MWVGGVGGVSRWVTMASMEHLPGGSLDGVFRVPFSERSARSANVTGSFPGPSSTSNTDQWFLDLQVQIIQINDIYFHSPLVVLISTQAIQLRWQVLQTLWQRFGTYSTSIVIHLIVLGTRQSLWDHHLWQHILNVYWPISGVRGQANSSFAFSMAVLFSPSFWYSWSVLNVDKDRFTILGSSRHHSSSLAPWIKCRRPSVSVTPDLFFSATWGPSLEVTGSSG